MAVSAAALAFLGLLRLVQRATVRLAIPRWLAPALGGALMGALGTTLAVAMAAELGPEARGFGVVGGGYGALQVAMTGATWLPQGATVVWLLIGVAVAKMVASALTIGSGAAAGDFAPSMVIGGMLGAALGPRRAWSSAIPPSTRPRSRSWGWGRSTAGSLTRPCPRWCSSPSWRAATTSSFR